MKAVLYKHPKKVAVEDVPDPKIEAEDDILLRVTATAICGSDLHIFNGLIPQLHSMVLGHEFMGVVEETGKAVHRVAKGDRVVVPFSIACGSCFFCHHGLPTHCENSNPKYGPEGGLLDQKGGGLFGYTDLYGGYAGGQAEMVRVPYANFGPRRVPERLTDEQVLFLTDIFPTGYTAVDWANPQPGETVAVFGCGPVGLMAQKVARARGAGQVIGLDLVPYRLAMAERVAGSIPVNVSETDAVEEVRKLTVGRGADICVDAVGMEADRGFLEKVGNVVQFERGSINALELAIRAARRGGRISVVGVYATPFNHFPWGQIFDKGLSLFTGQAPVQHYLDTLLDWVQKDHIRLDDIITHRLPLSEAAHGYDIFNRKEDGCVKVVLSP